VFRAETVAPVHLRKSGGFAESGAGADFAGALNESRADCACAGILP